MYVMVLNDGETYSNLKGCKIVWIIPADENAVEDIIKDVCKNGNEQFVDRGIAEIATEFK